MYANTSPGTEVRFTVDGGRVYFLAQAYPARDDDERFGRGALHVYRAMNQHTCITKGETLSRNADCVPQPGGDGPRQGIF